MTVPSLNDLLQQYLPHIGWGAVITASCTLVGICAKIYHWGNDLNEKADTLINNHAKHIEDYSKTSAENTGKLLGLAEAANTNNQTLAISINSLSTAIAKLDGKLEK